MAQFFWGNAATYNAGVEKARNRMGAIGAGGAMAGALLGAYKNKVKEGYEVDDQLEQLRQAAGVQLDEQILNADEETDTPDARAGETVGKEREDVPPTAAQGDGPQSSTTSYVKSGALGSREFGQGAEKPSRLAEALRFAGGPFVGTETTAMRAKKAERAQLAGSLERDKSDRAWMGSLSNLLTTAPDRAGALAQAFPNRFGNLKPGSLGGYQQGAKALNEWELRAAAARGEPWAIEALRALKEERLQRAASGRASFPKPVAWVASFREAKQIAMEEARIEAEQAGIPFDPSQVDMQAINNRARELLRNVPPTPEEEWAAMPGVGGAKEDPTAGIPDED